MIDPERILVKGKLHVFPHLPEDIPRFGPAILYATEIYECFNAVFRLCSIFSNHLAPSRDIAATLADMERFKHVSSGGWWKNSEGTYIRAGSLVRSFLTSNRELQRRLGWSETRPLVCGKYLVMKKSNEIYCSFRHCQTGVVSQARFKLVGESIGLNIRTHRACTYWRFVGLMQVCDYSVRRLMQARVLGFFPAARGKSALHEVPN